MCPCPVAEPKISDLSCPTTWTFETVCLGVSSRINIQHFILSHWRKAWIRGILLFFYFPLNYFFISPSPPTKPLFSHPRNSALSLNTKLGIFIFELCAAFPIYFFPYFHSLLTITIHEWGNLNTDSVNVNDFFLDRKKVKGKIVSLIVSHSLSLAITLIPFRHIYFDESGKRRKKKKKSERAEAHWLKVCRQRERKSK